MVLARPRRRRVAPEDEDSHVDAREPFLVRGAPRRRRSLFFAKIDADDLVDKFKQKFPETWSAMERSEAANKMMKKFDELTNPSFQPDRRRLSAVEDFFRYTEEEGESSLRSSFSVRVTTRQPSSCHARVRARASPTDATPSSSFAGRRFFDDMDSDGDGRLKLEDLKVR
jgi:hypothetical protein